jgi:hypothetical protein
LLRELVVPLAVGLLSLAFLLSTVALAVELARDLRSGGAFVVRVATEVSRRLRSSTSACVYIQMLYACNKCFFSPTFS